MINIKCDFENTIGRIKEMHCVGQPPFIWKNFTYFDYLKEANIPRARLHDVGGYFGGNLYVDIPNLFRDFDKDETDPENYDFTMTDTLIKELLERDCKPFFRLGVTIENFSDKRWRTYPPKDFHKWARICERVIMHYNDGWADGFNYNIEYWEIWNEPEVEPGEANSMWMGTDEEYFEFYRVASTYLKERFGNKIKVGGYASCGFSSIFTDPEKYGVDALKSTDPDDYSERELYHLDFFLRFMAFAKENKLPLDFFSWHSYAEKPGNVEKNKKMAEYCCRVLAESGYEGIETHLNEWNNAPGIEVKGTTFASGSCAAMLLGMQKSPVDALYYYDARLGASTYAGLFNPLTRTPLAPFYSMKAFGELYKLGQEVECEVFGEDCYAIAAKDGDKKAIMLVNNKNAVDKVSIENADGMKVYLIDQNHHLAEAFLNPKEFELIPYGAALIKNY